MVVVKSVQPLYPLRQMTGSVEIAAALEGIHFPITKRDLIVRLGSAVLEVDDEVRARIADIARGVPTTRFEDFWDAQRALDARWTRIAKTLADVERAMREKEDG